MLLKSDYAKIMLGLRFVTRVFLDDAAPYHAVMPRFLSARVAVLGFRASGAAELRRPKV